MICYLVYMPRGIGKIQKKVLLLLQGGFALGLASSPQKQLKVLKGIKKEWDAIDRRSLYQTIRSLYRSELIDFRDRGKGRVDMVLTKQGARRALSFNLDTLSIKRPIRWDKKWRIVCFDIPKEQKRARDALRSHLLRLGFYPFQKSIFIFPYSCNDELDFLIEIYEVRAYVRQIVAEEIDNALHLKTIFHIS
ncbi:MAG: hypothetical protein NUV53_04285 [Patescibacteria group bacterium]|nr:hypothetical protein [Patescibacteria group bacterium]